MTLLIWVSVANFHGSNNSYTTTETSFSCWPVAAVEWNWGAIRVTYFNSNQGDISCYHQHFFLSADDVTFQSHNISLYVWNGQVTAHTHPTKSTTYVRTEPNVCLTDRRPSLNINIIIIVTLFCQQFATHLYFAKTCKTIMEHGWQQNNVIPKSTMIVPLRYDCCPYLAISRLDFVLVYCAFVMRFKVYHPQFSRQ